MQIVSPEAEGNVPISICKHTQAHPSTSDSSYIYTSIHLYIYTSDSIVPMYPQMYPRDALLVVDRGGMTGGWLYFQHALRTTYIHTMAMYIYTNILWTLDACLVSSVSVAESELLVRVYIYYPLPPSENSWSVSSARQQELSI